MDNYSPNIIIRKELGLRDQNGTYIHSKGAT